MNQNLNKTKIKYNRKEILGHPNNNVYEFNIEFIPILCLESVLIKEKFFIYLHLKNIFSVSMTDIFKIKKIHIILYNVKSSIEFGSHSIEKNSLFDTNLVRFFHKSINFNEKFVKVALDFFHETSFLIEVIHF